MLHLQIMSNLISFQPDKEDEKNLALLQAFGLSTTQAIRTSLADQVKHLKSNFSISQEAELLAKNQKDLAEIASDREFLSGTPIE